MSAPPEELPYDRLTCNLTDENAGAMKALKREGVVLTDVVNDALAMYLAARAAFANGEKKYVVRHLDRVRVRKQR